MNYFRFSQNNSGGSFTDSEKLSSLVFIEAEDYDEANTSAIELGIYFDGVSRGWDCECCGDRWYPCGDGDGYTLEEVFDAIECHFRYPNKNKNVVVHHANGVFEKFTKDDYSTRL